MKLRRAFISTGFCWPISISVIRPFDSIVDDRRSNSSSYARKRLKGYKFADISVDECAQQNVRGSGPGGSCVNAAGNCVVLRHKPTNCFVKVHDTRSLEKNIRIAQERLKYLVDRKLNGESSYLAQFERLQREYEEKNKRIREKRRTELKAVKAEGDELRQKTEKQRQMKESAETSRNNEDDAL